MSMGPTSGDSPPAAADCVLGVFAKWPDAGRVKTRLAAETTPAFAATVAAALLDDTLDRWADQPVRRVLAFSPPESAEAFCEKSAGRYELAPQSAGDLGTRMADFFAARFRDGAARVVLIGTDSPTMRTNDLNAAFAALE